MTKKRVGLFVDFDARICAPWPQPSENRDEKMARLKKLAYEVDRMATNMILPRERRLDSWEMADASGLEETTCELLKKDQQARLRRNRCAADRWRHPERARR